jgi:hypothetical protein
VHLAPEQLDVAVVERMDGAEALLRVLQGDDGCERCFRHDPVRRGRRAWRRPRLFSA